jgi:hypothetical protein
MAENREDKILKSKKLYIASIWVLCKCVASIFKTNSKMSSGNGNYIMRNLTVVCFTIYKIEAYYIKDDEMGGKCITYVEDEKCLQYCAQELLREEANLWPTTQVDTNFSDETTAFSLKAEYGVKI